MKQVDRKQSRRRAKTQGRHDGVGIPELMMAVLDDALATYKRGLTSPVPAKRLEAFKVEAWVASDDADWAFAFVNVCHCVGMSPEYIRACLVRWRRKVVRDDDLVH
jgi:hypothetical protein